MPERYVSRAEIAGRLGLSERRITQLVKDGRLQEGTPFPSRVDGNERSFPWDRCFEWYIRFKQEEALRRCSPPPKETTTQLEAERRQAVADAGIKELKLARMRGELVPAALFGTELRAVLGRVAARFKAVPSEFAPQILGLEEIPRAQAALRDLVDTVLAELQGAGSVPEDDGEPGADPDHEPTGEDVEPARAA